MEFANVNWTAVIAGTVAAFLFGWLIYSPALFGKKWAQGTGISLESDSKPPVFAMVAQILALFMLATVIGLTETVNALTPAVLAILAAAVLMVANGAFSGKSAYARAVDGGAVVGSGVLMIAAQGLL